VKHFFRCHTHPDAVLAAADAFFPTFGLTRSGAAARSRTFTGELGTLTLGVKMEGGHYTFVEAHTDRTGESRIDRTAKKFFVQLHKGEHAAHAFEASY
jgi:hypothetical protein